MIAYVSRTKNTKKMTEYIAEKVHISRQTAELKKISEIKNEKHLDGYDGFIFGCPTYHRDMTENMKTFLFLAQKAHLSGKVGGAFGSHTHSGDAPKLIFDTMEHVFNMDMVDLGSFVLKEDLIDSRDGMRACQEYGKAVAQKLGT